MAQLPDGYAFEFALTHKGTSIEVLQQQIYKCKHCDRCELHPFIDKKGVANIDFYCKMLNIKVNSDFFCSCGRERLSDQICKDI